MCPSTLPRLQRCREMASVDSYDSDHNCSLVKMPRTRIAGIVLPPTPVRRQESRKPARSLLSNPRPKAPSTRCGYHYETTDIAWSEDSIERWHRTFTTGSSVKAPPTNILNNEQPRLKRPLEERWHRTAKPPAKKTATQIDEDINTRCST